MNDLIDDKFLEKNLFERNKIGCGYFPWRYEDKDISICIAPWCEGCKCFISGENKQTKENVVLEKPSTVRLKRSDLQRVIDFLNIDIEFNYE